MAQEKFHPGETVEVKGWGTCEFVRDNEFNVTVRPENHHENVIVARGIVNRPQPSGEPIRRS